MTKPIKILVKAEQLTLQGIAQYYIRLNDDEQKYLVLKDIFTGTQKFYLIKKNPF